MLYFANPCGDAVIAHMGLGAIGLIDTPAQRQPKRVAQAHETGTVWCADNGCFNETNWTEQGWWQFLLDNQHRADTCLFAVAPDVVGDAAATLKRSTPWLSQIRGLGYPVAYVAQDGWEEVSPPWDDFDVLFIGGTDDFKLGPVARSAVVEAKARGKHVHMGRVNSEKRFRYAHAIGCDSVDGTYLTYGPKTNLPNLLAWVRGLDQMTLEVQ